MASPQGRALVTGASSGIGAAIVSRLLDDGWEVVGVARRATAFEGRAYEGLTADLATQEGCASVCARVGGVRAFVHAAGVLEIGRLGEIDAAAGEMMWRLHVAAADAIANAVTPAMGAGGRIVLIGSRTAAGSAGRSQYAATKAALVAMARSWAIELAPRGITANVVAPAATQTAMLTDPRRDGVAPKLPPIGRYIRPDEVAAATAFLLSPDAGAITGQSLAICGGSSL
jgi:NAD(P)-dependent dehydrogenase (short-subunit alcohol dehydrogenase family)